MLLIIATVLFILYLTLLGTLRQYCSWFTLTAFSTVVKFLCVRLESVREMDVHASYTTLIPTPTIICYCAHSLE